MSGPPAFWWRAPSLRSTVLSPFAALYGLIADRRLDGGQRKPAPLPVLCIGNLTIGGGGKTPTALALGAAAIRLGLKPGFLSRGYRGSVTAPLLVDLALHDAGMVGDEPLLLGALAPTAVAVDRLRGAELLAGAGCDLAIMDDGFQSARLVTDHALLVVDASRGFGNGAVIPAGPMRATMAAQLRHADTILVVGEGRGVAAAEAAGRSAGIPVLSAALTPRAPERLAGRRLLAFAGIADPGKFYRSLRALGSDVAETRDFPDHHAFTPAEIAALRARAAETGLGLVTTAKDAVRLSGQGGMMAEDIAVLGIDLVFADEAAPERLIKATLAAFAKR